MVAIKQFSKEEFLSSVAMLTMAFSNENKEPRILSKSSTVSAFLGAGYCANLIHFVAMAVVFSFIPSR